MQYGFIKVCAATPEIRVADVSFNTQKIIDAIKESAKNGSQLTVFPELSVCGYTCGDLFGQPALIKACENALSKIAEATKEIKTLVFVGAPIRHDGKLFNCAIAIHGGKILAVIPKTFLPNYGEFYERRYFSSSTEVIMDYISLTGAQFVPFTTKILFMASNCPGFTVAAEVCEDLWTVQSPSLKHAQRGANVIVNLSCSNEIAGKAERRRTLIKAQSDKLVCGYVYCNAGDGESSTDMTFGGHNIIAENGKILNESKLFKNGLLYSEIDVEMLENERCKTAGVYYTDLKEERKEQRGDDGYYRSVFETIESEEDLTRKISQTPFIPKSGLSERCELVLTIQQKGLEKRLKHTHAKTVLLGVSGGLDSALALLVACRAFNALDKDLSDIVGGTMQCFGTTKRSRSICI